MKKAKKHAVPRDTITVVIPSNPRYLRALRALVDAVTHEMGFPPQSRSQVIQAIDEACTNVIKHSYAGRFDEKIVVRLRQQLARLEVSIRDFGRKVHPALIRPRPLHDVKPGGLGVYFIRRSMDGVFYDNSPPRGTELRMVKYMKGAGAASKSPISRLRGSQICRPYPQADRARNVRAGRSAYPRSRTSKRKARKSA